MEFPVNESSKMQDIAFCRHSPDLVRSCFGPQRIKPLQFVFNEGYTQVRPLAIVMKMLMD
jgi:hypothetical protein